MWCCDGSCAREFISTLNNFFAFKKKQSDRTCERTGQNSVMKSKVLILYFFECCSYWIFQGMVIARNYDDFKTEVVHDWKTTDTDGRRREHLRKLEERPDDTESLSLYGHSKNLWMYFPQHHIMTKQKTHILCTEQSTTTHLLDSLFCSNNNIHHSFSRR